MITEHAHGYFTLMDEATHSYNGFSGREAPLQRRIPSALSNRSGLEDQRVLFRVVGILKE